MLTPRDSNLMNSMCGKITAHSGIILNWRITVGDRGLEFFRVDDPKKKAVLSISLYEMYDQKLHENVGNLPCFGIHLEKDRNFLIEFLRKAQGFRGILVNGKPKYEETID